MKKDSYIICINDTYDSYDLCYMTYYITMHVKSCGLW